MTLDAPQRCPVCATPVRIPQAATEFRCPFCTTMLCVEYGFDGVTLHKEKPPLPVAPPPSEFERLLAEAQAPRRTHWQVWRRRLFGFEGRLRRSGFWVAFALGVPAYFLADYVVRLAARVTPNPWALALVLVSWTLLGFSLWLWLAVSIKRYHDRDKSGWWVLVGLIPYIGALWQVVELGFFAGSPGPNRFGEAE